MKTTSFSHAFCETFDLRVMKASETTTTHRPKVATVQAFSPGVLLAVILVVSQHVLPAPSGDGHLPGAGASLLEASAAGRQVDGRRAVLARRSHLHAGPHLPGICAVAAQLQ